MTENINIFKDPLDAFKTSAHVKDVTAQTQTVPYTKEENIPVVQPRQTESSSQTEAQSYWGAKGLLNEYNRGVLYGSVGGESIGSVLEMYSKFNQMVTSLVKEELDKNGKSTTDKSDVFNMLKLIIQILGKIEASEGIKVDKMRMVATLQGFANTYVKRCSSGEV